MRFGKQRSLFISIFLGWVWIGPNQCFADWTKTIECPAGTMYRDVRRYAGRDEFCEFLLPGSLWVREGPSRWWYSEGHLGEEGNYKNGRKVGQWRECSRFDNCRYQSHELVYPDEKARNVIPEIPVSYLHGKYVFDLSSCWSTWVTYQTPNSFLELNIGGGLIRCQITYIPSTEKDRPAGNEGYYFCEIPYSVGVRAFDSLDLRKELPKAGLPQFCRKDDPPFISGKPAGPGAQAFAIWANTLDSRPNKEVRVEGRLLANIVDIECASVEPQRAGPPILTVRLNEYAEKLVLDRVGKAEIKADACGGKFPLSSLKTARDRSGHTLFVYGLSKNPPTAKQQRSCIAAETTLQPTCASR
ncbi:MAG: hypothetical protein ACHQKY_14795 [Terriglobia bacterium]